MAGDPCPKCGQHVQRTPEGECAACGEALGAPLPPPAPPAPALSAPPPPENLAEGQRHCEGCGEALFATEEVCWRCGQRATGPPAPPPPPPPPPPAAAQPPPAGPPPIGERQGLAHGLWALFLAALGLISCVGAPLLAPLSLWLAAKAGRAGQPGLATAARVMAIVGIIFFAGALVIFVLSWVVDFGESIPPPS